MGSLILFTLIWLVSIPVVTWGLIALALFLTGFFFMKTDEPGVGKVSLGFFIGWLLAVGYWILAGYHIVTNVIEIIRLI